MEMVDLHGYGYADGDSVAEAKLAELETWIETVPSDGIDRVYVARRQ